MRDQLDHTREREKTSIAKTKGTDTKRDTHTEREREKERIGLGGRERVYVFSDDGIAVAHSLCVFQHRTLAHT